MAFLNDEDYAGAIRAWILNVLTNENPGVREQSERSAQIEMESYLRNRYDVGVIFEAQDLERNALVVMYLVDITLYHLHANISPENVPELRFVRYNAAKDWLKDVAKGNLSPNLPELSDPALGDPEDPDSIFLQMGSNEKTSERY